MTISKSRISDLIIAYLIPLKVYVLYKRIRYPRRTYANYKHDKWVKTVVPGDIVCDCRGKHVKVVSIDKYGDALTEDGMNCSLYHCCCAPVADDSCHIEVESHET